MRRPALAALTAFSTLAIVAGVAFVPASALGATPAAGSIRPAALAPAIPHGATRLGELPSTRTVSLDVVLQPSNPSGLANLLSSLYDPSSSQYQHWLTPEQFTAAFGPSATEVNDATSWLHERGLDHTSVQGFAVHATGSAQAVAGAMSVSFSSYRLADGSSGYAASSAPLVPQAIAGDITAIVGLSDTIRFDNRLDLPPSTPTPGTPRPAPHAIVNGGAAATGNAVAAPKACSAASSYAGEQFWTADQVGSIYGIPDLLDHNMTGQGKTIGLLELASSRPADTGQYKSCFKLHNPVTVTKVDGGAAASQLGTLEANIDIQEAATQAPGASITSYEAPNDGLGEYDAYTKMIHDNVPIISTSWGQCESALQSAPGYIQALHTLFQRAAAQGESVFAASGDKGSEDCYDPTASTPDTALGVDNPADDPLVTGVGGTSLEEANLEPSWNDCEGQTNATCASEDGDAGGGGQSTQFSRPKWQPKAADETSASCRGVPDLSANAGVPETFYDSQFSGSWIGVGGTSIASPKLAGLVADITTGCNGGRVGDFAPELDALAAKHVYGTALSDVTTGLDASGATPHLVSPGDNDLTRNNAHKFHSTTGFDLATGEGTPIARGLSCPEITALSPRRGAAGTHVTVHGLGLEQATIKFGSTAAKVLSANATSATVVVPAGHGAVSVAGADPIGAGIHHALFEYPGADTGAYRTVAADGGMFTFGGAGFFGSPVGSTTAPVIGIAVDHATGGYWLASSDGNVYNFNAPAYGSKKGQHLNQPIVGIAATTSGDGYWLVARDGGIFAFGNAKYHGSTGGMHLNQPIVGIAPDEHTGGYWLVASDGGIFAFDAPYDGSTGGMHLNQPIVGMSANPVTGGYWLVASDGGIFAFGTPFYGSTGGMHLNQPIVGMTTTGDAHGYWFVARDGGVFAFGDARFAGSEGGTVLSQPMVAIGPAH